MPTDPSTTINTFAELFNVFWPILGAIGAAIGTLYMSMRRMKKEQDDAFSEKIKNYYDELKNEATRLREENQRLISEIQKMAVDYAIMKSKWELLLGTDPNALTLDKILELGKDQREAAQTLQKFSESFPGLLWMKKRMDDGTFIIFAVSKKYVELYLDKPVDFYIGRDDSEIFPSAVVDAHRISDEKAFKSSNPIIVAGEMNSEFTDVKGYFAGWKWSIKIDDTYYICGYGDHYLTKDEVPKFFRKNLA